MKVEAGDVTPLWPLGEVAVSSNRAEAPVFAWGWGPTRARGGGAPRATK
jgi:hypothetical protein